MKWFEHRTDAPNNKKIRKIEIFYKDRGGQAVMAATGRFWRLMEIIGQQGQAEDGLDTFSLPDDYGLEVLADDLHCTMEELREFLDLLAAINSIDGDAWLTEEKIYSPKLGERADTYTKKLNRIRTEKKVCSNTVRTLSDNIGENPRKSAPQSQLQALNSPPLPPPPGGDGADDFSKWFEAYPVQRRKDRLKAEQEWRRLQRRGRLPPLPELLEVLARQARSEEWGREEGRFIPLPHRYLQLGRFVDASVAAGAGGEPPGICQDCRGTGLRRARDGEAGIDGRMRCECDGHQEARGP